MRLKLVNAVTELDLSVKDYPTVYAHPAINFRVKDLDRYGKPGSEITGDEQIDSRALKLQTDVAATSDSQYFSRSNALFNMFLPENGPLYLVDTDNERRCLLKAQKIAPGLIAGGNIMRAERWITDLIMVDSLWEDEDATIEVTESGGIENGESITVNNPGVVRTYPVIRITVTEANSEFSLVNTTTEDIFRFGSNALIPGTTLIVDCIEGTVYLDDGISQTEVSSAIADGSGLPYLAPGDNVFQYESIFGAANITFEFRRMWPL